QKKKSIPTATPARGQGRLDFDPRCPNCVTCLFIYRLCIYTCTWLQGPSCSHGPYPLRRIAAFRHSVVDIARMMQYAHRDTLPIFQNRRKEYSKTFDFSDK